MVAPTAPSSEKSTEGDIIRMKTARVRRTPGSSGWLWVLPALTLFFVFYAAPLIQMFYRSTTADGQFTLTHYQHIVQADIYFIIFWMTMEVGVLVTLISILVGYPVAYFLSHLGGRWLQVALIFILLPFWASVLVRNYAWITILSRKGIINSILLKLGIINEPLQLMFNLTGVVIGMSYVLCPFMILALYGVMQGIDKNYVRASASLGASPLQTFWRVFFPLSLPGIWAGSLLVFIMAIGFYITPALLGGGRVQMMATVIESQVRHVLNWGVGSALGVILLLSVSVIYYVFDKVLGIEHMFGARK
jgi:putative spermidine/putrescine transport system permease protein/spermidine/putrescine transport system permease protein